MRRTERSSKKEQKRKEKTNLERNCRFWGIYFPPLAITYIFTYLLLTRSCSQQDLYWQSTIGLQNDYLQDMVGQLIIFSYSFEGYTTQQAVVFIKSSNNNTTSMVYLFFIYNLFSLLFLPPEKNNKKSKPRKFWESPILIFYPSFRKSILHNPNKFLFALVQLWKAIYKNPIANRQTIARSKIYKIFATGF